MPTKCLVAMVAVMMVGCQAAPAADPTPVVNPYVTTDRSVDTRSVKSIAASLVKPGMSDRDKALAAYNYIRRTMYHYRFLTKTVDRDGGGAADLINMVGYCLCTPTAGAQSHICEEMGLRAEVLSTPGHGSCIVRWDDRWHWMDAFIGLTAWNKDRTELTGVSVLLDDLSLLNRDNPSPAPLLPCVDVLYADSLRFEPDNKEYHASCGPTDMDWLKRCKNLGRQRMIWGNTFSPDVTLRTGEAYTRTWDHEPGMFFLTKVEDKFAPPHHFCGEAAERKDTVNWPYFEPYVRPITSLDPKTGKQTTVRTGRYWANGRLTWEVTPRPGILKQFDRAENLQVAGGRFVPIDPAKAALLEWTVTCPYMLQGGRLAVVGANGRARASIRTDIKGEFADLKLQVGNATDAADLREELVRNPGRRVCTFRVELEAGASLDGLSHSLVFQHNMYAQPQLMPGANKVTVEVPDAAALKSTRLVVEFAWDDAAGKAKTHREVITASPKTFTVTIDGDRIPRMRYLTLANEGLLEK